MLANKSNKIVHHLIVNGSNDKIVVFDLQPGSERSLVATPPKGDFSHFHVDGRFNDGADLKNSAVFNVKRTEISPVYFISITNDGVEIERDTSIR